MPPIPPRLLLATTSADKTRELRQLLGDLPIDLVVPADLNLTLDVEETGATFRENADLKARAFQAASGLPCLAEDSGFEVDALDGAPGVRSARWEGHDYAHKNRLIVERVAGLSGVARRCRYVCVMAFAGPDGRLRHARGQLSGRVAPAPAGSGGFGYDPIFLIPRLTRTLAQLEPAEKNALSHRGRAARALRPVVERVLLGR
jgi:XTP/dITP diphosphohydrolase